MIEFTQKIKSFDEIKVDDLIRNAPESCASCFVLMIDSYDTYADVVWMLLFDTEMVKRNSPVDSTTVFNGRFYLNSKIDKNINYKEYYWTKL